ncbi:gas vesicle protein [Candidatus Roizmanbacteria bacterium]|nr:gas vesicle protein [Candidatus Roizmanbacteria bacterium]
MEPKELIEKAKKQLAELTGFKEPSGIGLKKEKEGWVVTVEMVEKKSIPEGMNIIGTYEVKVDGKGEILGYEKIAMRKKMDTGAFEKKEA